MKKARTSAEKEDGERCDKIWKTKRYEIVTQETGEMNRLEEYNRIASLKLMGINF